MIFPFLLFFLTGWIWCLWKWDQYHWLEQGTSQTWHVQLCQCTSILFFFFLFFVFIYILFNLALVKGAGLPPLEAEALYLPTEQIQHGRQLCKFPHAAPTHVPHLCPGGTTSRGERIVQSPWPIQPLAFLLRLPTKLRESRCCSWTLVRWEVDKAQQLISPKFINWTSLYHITCGFNLSVVG